MVDDGGLPAGPFWLRVPPHDKRPSGCTQWVSATPARKIPRDVNEDVREHVRALAETPAFKRSRDERKKLKWPSPT